MPRRSGSHRRTGYVVTSRPGCPVIS
jgi:hypothetical protein